MEEHGKSTNPESNSSDTSSLSSSDDIERNETPTALAQAPTLHPSASRRTHQSLMKLRSITTDGFSIADFDGYGQGVDQDPDALEKVPTSDFEVEWDGGKDPLSPRNFTNLKKWTIVFIVCFSSFCV